jgi:putative CocE/NonD family hydrolase
MLVEFFDHYVRDGSTGHAEGVGEIRYFTFNDGWKTTTSWPPIGFTQTRWFFEEGGVLTRNRPTSRDAFDTYEVDFTHTTGSRTRWHTQLGGGDVVYGDRAQEDAKLLTYTSTPMETHVEITGTVELDLNVASTHADGAFFAYLEVVDPDGSVRYLTEGQLRAIHRKPCESEPPYPLWGPCHSFNESDALPMVPGEPAIIRFGLFSTSVLVPQGHRIRIALAGFDGSVFDRYPAEGNPTWTVFRDRGRPSGVTVPMKVR